MNALDKHATMAHYMALAAEAARAPKRSAIDLATARFEEVVVTLQDQAHCTVRASWDEDDGAVIHAVSLEGVWLYPEDVLQPSRIACMESELLVMYQTTRRQRRVGVSA